MYLILLLTPLENNTFKVLEDFIYKGTKIPKGYITNGADVPRIFWYFFPPFKPKFLEDIVLHDYLISEAYKKGLPKDLVIKANQKFYEGISSKENTIITKLTIKFMKIYWMFKLK